MEGDTGVDRKFDVDACNDWSVNVVVNCIRCLNNCCLMKYLTSVV